MARPTSGRLPQLAEEDYADSYAEFFPKVYFEPLVLALSAITVDDMDKDAVREGLSKIRH